MINNGRFQILLRRRQNQSFYPPPDGPLTNVVVLCDPLTGDAQYIPGTVDNTSDFMGITPVAGWYDFSNYIEGDEKLTFNWDKTNQGDSKNSSTSQDGSNYDKGITSDLLFFDLAYHFVFNWLMSTECQIINCIEVKIIDLVVRNRPLNVDPAGNYRVFEIKADNLDYAPIDEPCQLNIKLREQDNNWHCIHKTAIFDNWQNWFNETGTSTKDHPCFLTCIEPRPRLVQSARMAFMLFLHSLPPAILFDYLTGQPTVTEDARRILNANRFVDAPLVRTYIQNVAGKCGLTMDTIFDEGRDWEKLCLYFPRAGAMWESDDDNATSPSLKYHFENRWLITIADLFDKLKLVFAAEWYVTPLNKIVFQYTKDLINLSPIYDFTLPGAQPFYGLRYTFNGDKRPGYGEYKYADDGSDLASQEIDTLYSDVIDFDGPAFNPMLEGEVSKNFEFAATGFVRDGRAKDYMKLLINDGKTGALILMGILTIVAAIFLPGVFTTAPAIALGIIIGITVGVIINKAAHLRNVFVNASTYTGAVRLTCEQTLTPRLILWDGVAMNRAKVNARTVFPIPNPYFNPDLVPYNVKNPIQTSDNPVGVIYNYPMYFDGDYFENLYPNFHDPIDNPLRSKETHQKAEFYVDLCEDMLNLFGVFQNQYAQIGKVLKVEERDNYDVFVRIGHISVDYGVGRIEISGNVIRRANSTSVINNPGNIPAEEPEDISDPTPTPEEVCLKWTNSGDVDSIATFRDCDGLTHTDITINPGQNFCAIEILAQSPETIVAGVACDGGYVPPPVIPDECSAFENVSSKVATISYYDCDDNLLEGVVVMPGGKFCAKVITDYGDCGGIIRTGLCDCPTTEDVFPVRDADDTMIEDSNGDIVAWQ